MASRPNKLLDGAYESEGILVLSSSFITSEWLKTIFAAFQCFKQSIQLHIDHMVKKWHTRRRRLLRSISEQKSMTESSGLASKWISVMPFFQPMVFCFAFAKRKWVLQRWFGKLTLVRCRMARFAHHLKWGVCMQGKLTLSFTYKHHSDHVGD